MTSVPLLSLDGRKQREGKGNDRKSLNKRRKESRSDSKDQQVRPQDAPEKGSVRLVPQLQESHRSDRTHPINRSDPKQRSESWGGGSKPPVSVTILILLFFSTSRPFSFLLFMLVYGSGFLSLQG